MGLTVFPLTSSFFALNLNVYVAFIILSLLSEIRERYWRTVVQKFRVQSGFINVPKLCTHMETLNVVVILDKVIRL